MINKIKQSFLTRFSSKSIIIKSPGRINLIGEHTDYNNGFVMPAAIDNAMYFAMGKNGNSILDIHSFNYDKSIVFENLEKLDIPNWGKYFKAILEILNEKGFPIQGVQCVFGGDIPIGAGLSSSAALCCGFIFGLSELFDLKIPREEIAKIGQAAEHRIGLNCGLMDQYAVLFGKKNHVFCLDCENLKIKYIPFQLEHHTLVLINSNIEHQLASADSEYNIRRASCEKVVELISKNFPKIKSLRDIDSTLLEKYKNEIQSIDFQRVNYVLKENDRVHEVINLLEKNDLKKVGNILLQGHHGLSKEYEVSLPELDILVDLAKKEAGVLGARLMGGGFGGATINLVSNENKSETLESIKTQYFELTGLECKIHEVKIEDGIKVINYKKGQ
ncbi:MAG: galactokinase [Saprospiraceae bacterium]